MDNEGKNKKKNRKDKLAPMIQGSLDGSSSQMSSQTFSQYAESSQGGNSSSKMSGKELELKLRESMMKLIQ